MGDYANARFALDISLESLLGTNGVDANGWPTIPGLTNTLTDLLGAGGLLPKGSGGRGAPQTGTTGTTPAPATGGTVGTGGGLLEGGLG